jgi:hypothetical protein
MAITGVLKQWHDTKLRCPDLELHLNVCDDKNVTGHCRNLRNGEVHDLSSSLYINWGDQMKMKKMGRECGM